MTTGRWFTDPEDPRVALAYRCATSDRGCNLFITAPFYEPYGEQWPWKVLCPACAMKHFGATPPETVSKCGVPGCIALHSRGSAMHIDATGRGWYDAEPALQPLRSATPNAADTIPAPPAPSCCALPWCAALLPSGAPAVHCSSRCLDANTKRRDIENRALEFVARMRARESRGAPDAIKGEIAWAKAKAAEEVETVRRAWRAGQHEEAQGDPKYFSVGEEE